MKRLIATVFVVLALSGSGVVGAQVPNIVNPPGNQTVSPTREGKPLADALGLNVANSIDVECDGAPGQKFSSPLPPEELCFLIDGFLGAQ